MNLFPFLSSSTSSTTTGMLRSNRGSFLVAGAFVLLLIMMICTFALDISYYFYQKQQLQSVTESAALAGAQALNQYEDSPNEAAAYRAALESIRNRQGEEYADLYEVNSPPGHPPTDVDGIRVWQVDQGSGGGTPCQPDFEIDNGSIQLNESTRVHAEVVGSALTHYEKDFFGDWEQVDGDVTVQIQLSSPGGDQILEPWGSFDDGGDGNVNHSGVDDYDLNDVPPGTKIDVRARSYLWITEHEIPSNVDYDPAVYGSVEPWIDAATNDSSDTQLVFTLKDGQPVPDLEGFGDQDSMEDFADPYLDDEGKAVLEPNEAIVFFELSHKDASDTGFDNQDLVVKIALEEESNYTGEGPSATPESNVCGDGNAPYRVGVLGKDTVQPIVLPSWMLGWTDATSKDGTRIFHTAVAGLGPQKMGGKVTKSMPCGVYTDGEVVLGSGGGFLPADQFHMNASAADFCVNDTFDASGTKGPGLITGNVMVPADTSDHFKHPEEEGASFRNIIAEGPHDVPEFKFTDPADYDVNLSNFEAWEHLGRCYVKVEESNVDQFVHRIPESSKGPRVARASLLPFVPSTVDVMRDLIGTLFPRSYSQWIPTPSADFAAPPGGFEDEDESDEDEGFVPNPIGNSPDTGDGGGGAGDGVAGADVGGPDGPDDDDVAGGDDEDDSDGGIGFDPDEEAEGEPPEEPEYVLLPIAKAMRTQGSDEADIRWSNSGQPVCVWPENYLNPDNGGIHVGGFDPYSNDPGFVGGGFEGDPNAEGMVVTDAGDTVIDNSDGMIRYKDGSPISIYSDFGTGDVIVGGFGELRGIKGGLYATGDIEIEMPGDGVGGSEQDYWFKGSKSKLGGLALWAEGDIDADNNGDHDEANIRGVRGIIGTTNGDIKTHSSEDDPYKHPDPIINGILISGGDLRIETYENDSVIIHNSNAYDKSVLEGSGWEMDVQVSSTMPDYANTEVNIVQSRAVGSWDHPAIAGQ